ncbi:hypothetical protein K1T71_005211 [Dendrolimus kikuchii]|uniref:Uncharacterized protein n=1 Tax=Dendrolimus kikuchii TaxID=765133 RepID=A0ACC1D6Z2_9NEOP|nr:hypothetical protein K1T71_005211 [Dendrolimus kikuchii]
MFFISLRYNGLDVCLWIRKTDYNNNNVVTDGFSLRAATFLSLHRFSQFLAYLIQPLLANLLRLMIHQAEGRITTHRESGFNFSF